MTILITGITGWLGAAIESYAKTTGLQTIGTSKNRDSTNPISLDLSNETSLANLSHAYRKLAAPCDALIHCAALAHQPLETPERAAEFWCINAKGTQEIVRFCQDVGIPRIVYISSIAHYEWQSDPVSGMNENSPPRPESSYARSKLAGEEAVQASGLDWRIARLATVFGSGDKANFLKLSTALKRRRFVVPGKGSARKSVIPVDLAARYIAELASLDEPEHRLINLALPEAPTLKEICDSFSSVCDFPRAPSIPLPLLRLLAKAGDLASHIRPMPLSSSVVEKLTTSTWVDTQRMQEVFSSIPRDTFATHLKRHRGYYHNA